MTDAEAEAMSANIDRNLASLGQFLRDCKALGRIAARYPRGTKLGNAVAYAHSVFMAKAGGVGAALDPVDPTDATEPRT